MQRIKCDIRRAEEKDRGMLVLLAEETLHPLAEGAGHPERYHSCEVVELLERADVFVAEAGGEPAGFVGAGDGRRRTASCAASASTRLRGARRRQPADRLGRGRRHRPPPAPPHGAGTGRRPPVPASVPRTRLRAGRGARGARDGPAREAPARGRGLRPAWTSRSSPYRTISAARAWAAAAGPRPTSKAEPRRRCGPAATTSRS